MSNKQTHKDSLSKAIANGFDPKAFHKIMNSYGHSGHIGLEYHDHGGDWIELKLPYQPMLVGDMDSGVIASGPIISMLDNATSMSCWIKLGEIRPQVTLDLRVDYMRPATPGKTIYGRGECYHLTHNIAFIRGLAHEGDREAPIAHASGTFIRLPDFTGQKEA